MLAPPMTVRDVLAPRELTRDAVRAQLQVAGFELLNWRHEDTPRLPRFAARHPTLGTVAAIFAEELLDLVQFVTDAAAELQRNGRQLQRASHDSPWSIWTTELGIRKGPWACELPVLLALLRSRPGWRRVDVAEVAHG